MNEREAQLRHWRSHGCRAVLKQASARKQFSARALDRIARAARTIADLAGSDEILAEHVAEAVHYRSLERLATAA